MNKDLQEILKFLSDGKASQQTVLATVVDVVKRARRVIQTGKTEKAIRGNFAKK